MEAQEAASQNTQYKIQLQEIVAPLLEWYAANARALPWRENTDPYRVWVSEIMRSEEHTSELQSH